MMTTFQKAILILLVACISLASCSVKPPDAIAWDASAETAPFGNVGTTNGPFESIPTVNCTEDESRAGRCTGDSEYGYDSLNGDFFCYVDGECYRFSESATSDQKAAVTNTIDQIGETKGKLVGDTGEAIFAYAASLVAMLEMGLIAGCTVGAALTAGGACLVALIGAGVAGIYFIVKYWTAVSDAMQLIQAHDYLIKQVDAGVLIPCGGN